MEKKEQLRDMVRESIEEHRQVKTLLKEMDALASDSDKLEPKLKVLQGNAQQSRGRRRGRKNVSQGTQTFR